MAGPLEFLRDPSQKGNEVYGRMGTDIEAPIQGQLLLEALARALPLGGGSQSEQAEAKAREARVKGTAGPTGGKDLDVGQLLALLMSEASTNRPVQTNEGPESIGAAFRTKNLKKDYDEEQAEDAAYRKP